MIHHWDFPYPIDDKIEGRHYSSSSRSRHLPFKFDEEKCHVPTCIHIFNSRSAFALQQSATTTTYHSCIGHLPPPLPRLPFRHCRDTQYGLTRPTLDWSKASSPSHAVVDITASSLSTVISSSSLKFENKNQLKCIVSSCEQKVLDILTLCSYTQSSP